MWRDERYYRLICKRVKHTTSRVFGRASLKGGETMPLVSHLIQAITALTRGEIEFRSLLENLPAAAYTCDTQGLITYFNKQAVKLWGREPALNDLVDRFCGSFRLFAPDGAPISHDQCWMALALNENKAYNGHEIIIERPDGKRLTVLAYADPFHDEAGNLTGAVNVLVDISDRKLAEDMLREADRSKDEFLAMLAHELRNPLAPIQNALQLLRLDADNGATREQACTMMERQLQQMVRLVDDLSDVSRITSQKLALRKERIELAAVLRTAAESTRSRAEESGLELVVDLPPEPIDLEADPARLAQVFSNLLNNAVKYTVGGGRVWLAAEREGSDAVVKVRDTGVGIPPEMLARIFDLFTQVDQSLERSQGGLGIGLSLVRGLVEMHGGSIEARSDGPGRGSEFVVRLPVVLSGKPHVARDLGGSGKTIGSLQSRILVVDDNYDSANSLAKILRLMGNEVRTAHDGVEAVDVAAAFQPHLVLLDIGLPKMNGYDAAREIRNQPWGKDVILIAVTGWGQDDDKRRATEAGFDLHMVKPVDPSALESLLARLHPVPA
jgi:PAS domain S-box-containing protein